MILKDIDKVTMKASGMDDKSNKVIRHLINGFVIEESTEPFITEAQKKLRANLLKQNHMESCKKIIQRKSKAAVTCVKAISSPPVKISDSVSNLRIVKPADSDLKNDPISTTSSCIKSETSKAATVVNNTVKTVEFDENILSAVASHTHLTSDLEAASSSSPGKLETLNKTKVQEVSNEEKTTSPPKALISATNASFIQPENMENDIAEMDISETVDITVVLDASKDTVVASNLLSKKTSIDVADMNEENVSDCNAEQESVTCSFGSEQNRIVNSKTSDSKSKTEDKKIIVENPSVSQMHFESYLDSSVNETEKLSHSPVFAEKDASLSFNVNTTSSEATIKTLEHDNQMDCDEPVSTTKVIKNHLQKDKNVGMNDENVPCSSHSLKADNGCSKTSRKDSCVDIEHTSPSSTLKKISKPVIDWSVDDVFEFLRSVNELSRFANEFKLQEIDGEALLLLELDHLMNSMSFPLGPALKLIDNIKKKDKLFSQ